MAIIKQVGVGRNATGTIDGITYYTRNGVTYARSTPIMPARMFKTPAALKRQAIFKMVQMHLRYHQHTIKQTFTPKGNGNPYNRYHAENGKHLTCALAPLAERWVAGEVINISEVEAAISGYATEHPDAIKIAMKDGFEEVFLTGAWPEIITLHMPGGGGTVKWECHVVPATAEHGAQLAITLTQQLNPAAIRPANYAELRESARQMAHPGTATILLKRTETEKEE